MIISSRRHWPLRGRGGGLPSWPLCGRSPQWLGVYAIFAWAHFAVNETTRAWPPRCPVRPSDEPFRHAWEDGDAPPRSPSDRPDGSGLGLLIPLARAWRDL